MSAATAVGGVRGDVVIGDIFFGVVIVVMFLFLILNSEVFV